MVSRVEAFTHTISTTLHILTLVSVGSIFEMIYIVIAIQILKVNQDPVNHCPTGAFMIFMHVKHVKGFSHQVLIQISYSNVTRVSVNLDFYFCFIIIIISAQVLIL